MANKTDLVNRVAEELNIPKKTTDKVVETFLKHIVNSVSKGEKVTIIGFGSFSPKERAARKGQNPRTRETIDIKASKSVGFKAGKTFKDAVK